MGLIGSVFAVASVAGPLLGGFLVDTFSWRWIFYVNLPVGAVAIVIVALRLHLPAQHLRHRIDVLGAALLTAGVAALILMTTWGGNQYAWGSATIVGLGIAGVVLLVAFIWQERRAAEPLMPPELFRSDVFNVASAMGFTIGMAMFGAIVFIPFFLQIVFGASPTSSGLRMLPLMAGLLIAAISSGRAITRMGRYRVFPIAGTAILVVGMFLLSRLGLGTPHWQASAYMAVVGVGIGLVMQVLVLVVQNDADPRNIGAATSTATFFRSLGGSFGVAIFGAIYASRLSAHLRDFPPAAARQLAKVRNPEQVKHLPPVVRADFLQAFSHSLHAVFLWGMAVAIVPFALSWLLKEVPLRTTLHRSDLAAEEASAGGTGSEALVEV
jgi:EmrB/QacA subfamily drug resistance transporter